MRWQLRGVRRVTGGVVVGAALLAAAGWLYPPSSNAQEPTATPDFPQPPPEVIHCARPFAESVVSSITTPESFAVVLDSTSGKATLLIPDLPAGATCYVVFKTPRDSNPIVLEWDANGVEAPGEFVDAEGFPSAGEYCYTLIVANPTGRSEGVERCIDVPPGVAPTATPTVVPSVTPPTSPGLPGPVSSPTNTPAPAPPDVGSGRAGGDDSFGGGPVGWTLLLMTLTGAGGLVTVSRLRRKR